MEMEKENKFKKISSGVPREVDFVEVVRSVFKIPDCKLNPHRLRNYEDDILDDMRENHVSKVRSAGRNFWEKLFKVVEEFPSLCRLDHWYSSLLHQRYNMHYYANALSEVSYAMWMVDMISEDYGQLLEKDDCDSRDKCKSLKVTTLACMFTVAKRCLPALAYLEELRVYMANLEDDAATTLKKGYVLPVKNYPFPPHVKSKKIADFVDPETLLRIEELDRRCDLWLNGDDDQGEDCAKLRSFL